MLNNKADSLDWLDLETDVTTPPQSVGDLIVREEENNTWSILRSVDGVEPEVDPGYQSKDDALQAARLGAEGGKITIERRISKVITAAKIHAGMIARLGTDSVTITDIDGHDISIMHVNGEQQLVDASQLSNIKEAFGEEAYPMYQDGEPEIGHMPGMKMDEVNPLIKIIEEIEEVLEGPEEVEEDIGMEDMMMEIDPGMESITMEIEPVDPLLEESEVPDDEYVLNIGPTEEEMEKDTEEMAGMMTGPPVYIVDMKSMPGENQSKGAQKTAKVHMSQEKGERPEPRIDIKGILETYERIGIPVSAAEAKIGEMLLVKDADGFHVEEELVNGAIQRKGPNVAQEQVADILATIGFNSNTTAQLIATATKKGHASLGDQMGFLVKADHYLIMTSPGTYTITDEVSVIAEGLDQFRAYDTLLASTSLDPQALSEVFDRAQVEPEVQISETFGDERAFETGEAYDLDLQPTSIPDGSDAGMESGSGLGSAMGTRKIRIANVKIAKEVPTCKKCNKAHWPFQKCDSAEKKEDKPDKDLEGSDESAITAAGKCPKCGKEKCTCTKAKDKSEKGDTSEDTSEAMRTAKAAPTCKKCGKPHWPFKPCSGSEKKDEPEKAKEDSDEKEASKQLDITTLSTGAFQQLQAKVKRQAAVKDNPKLDEQCILLDREAKRRELPDHKYNVYQRVIVTAKGLPKAAGVIVEYGQDEYLVQIANKHQLWFKEAEVAPSPNPDTTTVPWTQRSKKIVDPENSKQNADFKKELSAKTGQSPAEMTLESVAEAIVDAVVPEASLRDWVAGERGASYEELVEGAFEVYRDALLAEAQTKFPQIAEHADLGPQLEMTLKDVLSWNLPRGNSGEDMRGMSLEMDYMEGTVSDSDMIDPDSLRAILVERVGEDPLVDAYVADAMSYGDSSVYPPNIDPETLALDFAEYKAWAGGTIDEMAMGEEATADEMAMGEETTVDEMAMGEDSAELKRDYREPDAYGRSYAMKVGSAVRIASTFETDIKEVAQLRDMKIKGTIVALNNRIADVRIGSDILRIARSGLEVMGYFFRDSIIRRCAPGDIDPDRPESAQKWCLYSRKNDKVLGRHATKKEAVQQEKAIKAQGGIFIAAEMPEEIINRSLFYEEKAISDYGKAISSLPVGSADAEVLKEIQQDEQDHADIFNKLKDGEDATALLAEANCGKPHGTEKGTAAGPPIGGMPGAAGDSDQKSKPDAAPPSSPSKGDKPDGTPEETCVCPLDGKEYPKEAGVPCTNSSCQDHSDVQLVRKPTGPPPKEPVKKAFMQLAESVRCYADALLERVLTGNITSSEAVKELNSEAKRWGWSSTQKKFVKNKLQGKVAHMKRMSAEDDVSSLLNELERGDAQAVIRTLDDATEVSEALTGLGLGDDTSDLRSWLIDAPGMSPELLQTYAQDPVPANRLLALDRIADRFPEANVSAWLQDPYPYISEKAAEIQAGAGSPLATEDPLNPVTDTLAPAPIEPLPAADPSGQVNIPLAAAKDTPPGNAPPIVDYDPLGLVEKDDATKKKAEAGSLALTYDEPNGRYLLYNMDFGPVAPEGAQIKDIKGQLEAYGICTDRIQEALDAAKKGIAVIKIARVANAENIDIELADAVDAAVLGFSDKSAMEGLTDGSSRGSLTMSALLEVSKRLGISKEDTSAYYGDRIKELLDIKLDAVPRPEIPGTKQEFMSFQSKKPRVSKEAKTPTPEEKKQIVTDLAKHGIPLREVTPMNEPPVDIPPDRMLSTIGIFKKGDRVRDNAVTELKGTVMGFDSGGNVIVAMDKSFYCPEGGEGLYPPEGLANMRL